MSSSAGVAPLLASAGRHAGSGRVAAAFVVGAAIGGSVAAVAVLSSLKSLVAYLSSDPDQEAARTGESTPEAAPSAFGVDPLSSSPHRKQTRP